MPIARQLTAIPTRLLTAIPARLLTTAAACAIAASAATSASATINDLTTWQFYYDNDPGPGPLQDATTGSAAPNLAQLNFLNDVDVPAGYDIGFSSINANTVAQATSGYYFSAAEDFSVSLDFSLTLADRNGMVALGLGVGEDRKGVNSAGIGMSQITAFGFDFANFQGAFTNNDNANIRSLANSVNPSGTAPTYAGTLSVAYDVDPLTNEFTITVGATGLNTSSTTITSTGDLTAWAGDDLLVSFFLRSDSFVATGGPFPVTVPPWTGTSAQASFSNLTVTGSATQVPEPTSLALLALTGLAVMRRRRS